MSDDREIGRVAQGAAPGRAQRKGPTGGWVEHILGGVPVKRFVYDPGVSGPN